MHIIDLRPGDLLIRYNLIKFLVGRHMNNDVNNTLMLFWLVRWTNGNVETLTENLPHVLPTTKVAEDYTIVVCKTTDR